MKILLATNNQAKVAEIKKFLSDTSFDLVTLEELGIVDQSPENGKTFEELHRQIMLFKNWLVGIHHKWSKQHLHAYCDEYVFRLHNTNKLKEALGSCADLF